MNSIVSIEKITPCGYKDILGCNGYDLKNIICVTANGDDNFLNEGIVEGSILFVDTGIKYKQGQLNVFKFKEETSPQFKLSRTKLTGTAYVGKVLITINQYN